MTRLQKKCFIASTGGHLLLVALLFIGPAFLASSSKRQDVPLINFIPLKTVDEAVSGGGDPTGGLPPMARPAPTPPAPEPPKAVPAIEPEPPRAATKPAPDKPAVEPGTKPQRQMPDVSTTPVKRRTDRTANAKARAAAEAQAAEERQRLASAFSKAASGIESGIAGSTSVKLLGPGGGVPYANWRSAVQSVYERAWVVPEGLDENTPPVTAQITIARDGSVISARVVRGSGNGAADESVRAVLLRVKFAAPLPDTETSDRRTITIDFVNDKAKRLLG